MDDLKGYDEVFNLLLEHSFRYFGPASNMTTKITDNQTWNPSIDPNENSLVRLVDPALREGNEAYLNYYYIMDYYLFDSFLNKIKFEVDNPKNKTITSDRLHELKFDEEELRKVMGNIGHLLLKERSLISDQSSYDFLNLYFQIKKLWSIIITVRYLKESVEIGQIKVKIQKSFLQRALQEIDKANVMIENYLISFEDIYQSKESVEKHIDEFFREYLLRYFQYIIIGLTHFQKDFLHSISTKFTSIDLIKESLNALHPTNAFHKVLIEFLRPPPQNLQTEKEMEEFIGLIERQRIELIGVEPDSTGLDERADFDGTNLADDQTQPPDPFNGRLQNDPNLNELSVNNSQSAGANQPAESNPDALDDDQNELNNLLGDSLTFTTLDLNTPREDDQNNENQLNESMNQDNGMETNELDVDQLENPIDDQVRQFDSLLSSDADQGNRANSEQSAGIAAASTTSADHPPQLSAEIPDLTKVAPVIKGSPKTQKSQKSPQKTQQSTSETDQTSSATEPATTDPATIEPAAAVNSAEQELFSLPTPLEPVNTSTGSLNRSNSGSNLRNLTELTRFPEDEHPIDMAAIHNTINNFPSSEDEMPTPTPNFHDMTASATQSKTSQANESDELDDLGLTIKVREVTRPAATPVVPSFDFSVGPNAANSNLSKFDLLFPSASTPNKRPAEEDKRPAKELKRSAKEDKRPAKEDKRPAKEDKRPTKYYSTDSEDEADATLKQGRDQEPSKKGKGRTSRKRAQSDVDNDSGDDLLESSRRKKKANTKQAKPERTTKRAAKKRLLIESDSDSDESDDNKRSELAEDDNARFENVQLDSVDEETMNRILNNQPKIVLKPVGEVRHRGKLVPIFN